MRKFYLVYADGTYSVQLYWKDVLTHIRIRRVAGHSLPTHVQRRVPSWYDKQPSPKHGDTIQCGPLSLLVGCHNGDFRSIILYDHLGRKIARGDVSYRALREIQDAA